MKSMFKRLFTLLALALCLAMAAPSQAPAGDQLTIAAGAGYKQLVLALDKAFAAETGITTQKVFGNMGYVIAQAQRSGVVDVVIGDKSFLDKADLKYSAEDSIGQGRLILAVPKRVKTKGLDGVKTLDAKAAATLLTDPAIKRVAFPDKKKAIYGRATWQMLNKTKLLSQVESKLLMVGTVPQVSAYVVSGEVDLGFINLTDALAIEPKVQRIVPVDESLYSPIRIVAKTLGDAPDAEAAKTFGKFLATDKARAIAAKHGL